MDSVCTAKNPDKPSETLGARVYGNCDQFMKELMKHLLGKEELEEWESEQGQRMTEYDGQRADA